MLNFSLSSQALSNLTALLNKESQTVPTNARKQENGKSSDIPGDQFKVKLACSKTDSINAVYVDGYLQSNRYILAQTPLVSTVEEFASLLYQENVGLVISLDEDRRNDKTFGQYIAPVNKVSTCGRFQLSAETCESNESYVIRTLKVSIIGKPLDKKIVHYHFNEWKNDIVPESMHAFVSLLLAVNGQRRTDNRPILTHCRDGAKKSGLVCAIAIMLEKLTIDRELSVINTICHVRGKRRSVLQDFEQFKFCYTCVHEYVTSESKDYSNVL